MSLRVDPEETAALAVFAELGRAPGSNDTRVTAAEDEVEEVLRRLNLEGLGLFAWALDPAEPAPGTRTELLARLSADATQEVPRLATARVEAGARSDSPAGGEGLVDLPPGEAETVIAAAVEPPAVSAAPPEQALVFPARGAARRRRNWAAPLAAVLGLVAIGLGAASTWFASELSSARYRAARLETELARVRSEQATEIAGLRNEVAELERRRQFASGPATVVFPLRPPFPAPQPLARGRLWVAADHQHWQLEVAGLTPNPEGREYQVWFLVDGIPLAGGCFQVQAGRTGVLADARMPPGTQGVAITLERVGGAQAPSSAILLQADRAVEL